MQAEQRIHRVDREIGYTRVHKQSQMFDDFMNDLSTDCTNYYDRQFHEIIVIAFPGIVLKQHSIGI